MKSIFPPTNSVLMVCFKNQKACLNNLIHNTFDLLLKLFNILLILAIIMFFFPEIFIWICFMI